MPFRKMAQIGIIALKVLSTSPLPSLNTRVNMMHMNINVANKIIIIETKDPITPDRTEYKVTNFSQHIILRWFPIRI